MNRTKIEEMLKEAEDCIDRADNYRSIDYWRGRKSLLLELLAEDGGEVKESSDVCVWTHTVGLDKFDIYKSPHVGVSYRHGKPDNCLVCGKKIVIAPSQHSTIVKDEWISVEERLPNDEPVLCLEGKNHRFVGFYTVGDLIEYDDYESGGFDEHLTEKEEKDQCRYLPKGWYEEQENRSNDGEFFRRKVTHWMPLPPAPSKGEAQ